MLQVDGSSCQEWLERSSMTVALKMTIDSNYDPHLEAEVGGDLIRPRRR